MNFDKKNTLTCLESNKRFKPDCSQTCSPWSLHSIFMCNTELGASEDELEIARFVVKLIEVVIKEALSRSSMRNIRNLSHPALLNVIQVMETETSLLVISERVTPLKENIAAKDKVDHISGLLHLSSLLAYLHQEVNLLHNNLNLAAVFVTSKGVWKLGGFEFAILAQGGDASSTSNNPSAPSLRFSPPEDKDTSCSRFPFWSREVWSFGCLIWEVFNTDTLDVSLPILQNIPLYLQPVFKKCFSRNPKKRPSFSMIEELLSTCRVSSQENLPLAISISANKPVSSLSSSEPLQSTSGITMDVSACPDEFCKEVGGSEEVGDGEEVGGGEEVGRGEKIGGGEEVGEGEEVGGNEEACEGEVGGFSAYECPLCSKSYLHRQHLRRHTKAAHKSQLEELLPKKKFECANCDKSFSYKHCLKRHMVGYHKVVEDIEE